MPGEPLNPLPDRKAACGCILHWQPPNRTAIERHLFQMKTC